MKRSILILPIVSVALCCITTATAETKEVCVVGYVMDTFCIDRGTLLDNPSVKTLEHPEKHTIHCLVDVPRCYDSGFEILSPSNDTKYCRGFKLDSNGNNKAHTLARSTGSSSLGCSTCGSSGTQKNGFRATIKGTYDTTDSRFPVVLTTTSVEAASVGCDSSKEINPCLPTEQGGTQNAASKNAGAGGAAQNYVIAHGSLMIVSWGLLLPAGVIIAHFLRHRDPTWFLIHRALQYFGIICAVSGFIIAVTQFSVFSPDYYAPGKSKMEQGTREKNTKIVSLFLLLLE
jgi:hypothetical protein